jgi:hemoglobin
LAGTHTPRFAGEKETTVDETMTATPTSAPTMYDRIGGAAAIREAVDRFYRRLLDDPQLAGYFHGDLAALKRHQAALLTQVLGGPGRYQGEDLDKAHAHLRIPRGDFRRVVFYLVGTVWEMGAPMDVIMAIGETVASLESQIVTAPEGAGPAPDGVLDEVA